MISQTVVAKAGCYIRTMSKIRPPAASLIAQVQDNDLVDVVVELVPEPTPSEGSRENRIQSLKNAFNRKASVVAETVHQLGGEVLEEAWINQTLRARVPAKGVQQLAELSGVHAVDTPRALQQD